MQFEMNGKQYDVMFQYEDVESWYSGTPVKKTHCFISYIDPDKQGRDRFVRLVDTVVVQNPIDPFVKAAGRRKALHKALKHRKMALGRQERTEVWKRYFETHKDLRK